MEVMMSNTGTIIANVIPATCGEESPMLTKIF